MTVYILTKIMQIKIKSKQIYFQLIVNPYKHLSLACWRQLYQNVEVNFENIVKNLKIRLKI